MGYKIRPDVAKVVMAITKIMNSHKVDYEGAIHWGHVMGWLSGSSNMPFNLAEQFKKARGFPGRMVSGNIAKHSTPKIFQRFQELWISREAGVGGEMGFYYDAFNQEGYFYPHNDIPNVSDNILDWSHEGMFVNSDGNLVDETGWEFAPYLYFDASRPPTINYDFLR